MNKTNRTIKAARAIIRIGDAAGNANDYSLLGGAARNGGATVTAWR